MGSGHAQRAHVAPTATLYELLIAVRDAQIRDAKLRDEATRAAKRAPASTSRKAQRA